MKIITFYIIFFYLYKKCINYIVYPLYVYNELNQIENFLLFNSTYTTLEMGNPPQKINFYFSLEHNKMNVTDINCQDKNLFDINYSETFTIIGYPDTDEQYSSKVFSLDEISFYDNIDLTKIVKNEKFYMYYYADLDKEENYVCGNIGLGVIKYEEYDEEDEIEYYLKYIRTQNKYFSFYSYNGKDYIVNSILLNQEFKDKFHDIEKISWVNPIMRNNCLHWEISMKEIFYNKIYMKNKIVFELNPLFELIIGTKEYKNNILKDYFNYYINKHICLIREINEYQVIECDENEFGIKDIKEFPGLYTSNVIINYKFEMLGEELFFQLNKKFYFSIIFPNNVNGNNKWIIGKIFMRKYPIIFSPLNRIVGFYINPNGDELFEQEEEEDEEQEIKVEQKTKNRKLIKDKNLYLEIIIISFVFTCLGLYLGRRLFLNRRKKLNELVDDYYQYDSDKTSDKIKNPKNIEENSYSSIEMCTKIEKKGSNKI